MLPFLCTSLSFGLAGIFAFPSLPELFPIFFHILEIVYPLLPAGGFPVLWKYQIVCALFFNLFLRKPIRVNPLSGFLLLWFLRLMLFSPCLMFLIPGTPFMVFIRGEHIGTEKDSPVTQKAQGVDEKGSQAFSGNANEG